MTEDVAKREKGLVKYVHGAWAFVHENAEEGVLYKKLIIKGQTTAENCAIL